MCVCATPEAANAPARNGLEREILRSHPYCPLHSLRSSLCLELETNLHLKVIRHSPLKRSPRIVFLFSELRCFRNAESTVLVKDFSESRIFRILRSKFWHSGRRTSQKSHTDTAQLPSSSFSDSVHYVTNAAAYCLASILPLGFSNHYPPHLRRV